MAEKEYTVVAPDGKEITLIGPVGASQADVIAQAQKLYNPAPQGNVTVSAPSTHNGLLLVAVPQSVDLAELTAPTCKRNRAHSNLPWLGLLNLLLTLLLQVHKLSPVET